jgi:hypothetical protein
VAGFEAAVAGFAAAAGFARAAGLTAAPAVFPAVAALGFAVEGAGFGPAAPTTVVRARVTFGFGVAGRGGSVGSSLLGRSVIAASLSRQRHEREHRRRPSRPTSAILRDATVSERTFEPTAAVDLSMLEGRSR